MWQASFAYSSGRPRRGGNGIDAPSASRASWGRAASRGVSNSPGAIVQTRMPSRARSRAAGKVKPTTPPFDAEYAVWPIWPSKAAIEAVITTAPRSPSASGSPAAIAAAARRSTLKVPIRFTRTKVSNGWSAAGPSFFTVRSAHPTPRHDTASRSPSTDSTAACTCASSVTSAAMNAPPISAASAPPRSSFRSATVTRAPRAASSRAVASPSPDAPPATSARIPFSSIGRGSLYPGAPEERRREPRQHPRPVQPPVQPLRLALHGPQPVRADVLQHLELHGAALVLAPAAHDPPVPPDRGAGVPGRVEDLLLVRPEVPAALVPAHRGGVEWRQQRRPRLDRLGPGGGVRAQETRLPRGLHPPRPPRPEPAPHHRPARPRGEPGAVVRRAPPGTRR